MQPTTSGELLFLVTPSFAHTFPHQWPGHPRNLPLLCCCGYYVTMALGSRALQHDVAVGAGRQGRCGPRPLGVLLHPANWCNGYKSLATCCLAPTAVSIAARRVPRCSAPLGCLPRRSAQQVRLHRRQHTCVPCALKHLDVPYGVF